MFFLIRQDDLREVFPLSEADVTVGREAGCEFCISCTDVSRRHARIACRNGGYFVQDLGSLNGTLLNGQPLTEERELHLHDRLEFGSVRFRVAASPDEEFPTETRVVQDSGVSSTQEQGTLSSLDVTMGASEEDQASILRTISHSEGQKFLAARERSALAESSWTQRAQGYLQMLYEMSLSLGHCTEMDRLADELLGLIFRWIDTDRGCILLFDPVTNRLEPKAKRVRENVHQPHMIISKTILDYVLEHQEGVLTSDAMRDARWDTAASVLSVGIHEAICVPLQGRYGIVGAIYLDTFSHPDIASQQQTTRPKSHRFGDEHLKLMITIAHHTAIAIEDTRHYSGMLQAERLAAIGQTVATLSHHIKNILQGIQGGSYLIETGLNKHDETFVSKGWQIVERNQNRISSLVMDMLTFSKERKPDWEEGDLNQTVGEVVELMQTRALGVHVRLTWTPDARVPKTWFDAEAIHHAVLTLVTNAIDAVAEELEKDSDENAEKASERDLSAPVESVFKDGSHIFDEANADVTAEEAAPSASGILTAHEGQVDVLTCWESETQCVKILVKDTGVGLTKEQIRFIFKPFESSKGIRGSGLGLPVCQKIIREHGGTIRVEQRQPHGSRFIITLPITAGNPAQSEERSLLENSEEG